MNQRTSPVDAWEALYRAQVAVLRGLLATFPDEISFTEYDVLFNLYRHRDGIRIRDLNRHLLLTQPSVSRLLDRLAVRGLVSKRSDPSDARGTIVALTDAGLAVFRRVGSEHARDIKERMSVLGPEELAELAALTDKLRAGASPN